MAKIRNAVIPLVVINIGIFFLQIILDVFSNGRFTDAFLLIGRDMLTRPWILVTSMFLHAGPMHIIFNMYVLFIFGPFVEQKIGTKRFLFLYFLSGVVASLCWGLVFPNTRALGASGAILGVIGTLIVLFPNLQVLLFFIIPMPLWIAGIAIALIDLFGIIPGVAGLAHLAGMGCGVLYGLYLKRESKNFRKGFSSKTHMDIKDIQDYLRSGRI